MNDLGNVRLHRCLLVWSGATAAALTVVAWSLPDLPLVGSTAGPVSFDRLLVQGCALALVLCAAWGWAVTTLVVAGVLRGSGRRADTVRGVPAPVRRWVLAACGVAVLTGGLSPAHATPGSVQRDDRPHSGLATLHGLPLPDRPTGGLRHAAVPVRPPLPAPSTHVVVRPGDSLWSIAAAALGPDADQGEVSTHWRRVHELNRDVIGPDPDLIHPGQHLLLPDRPVRHRGES